MISRRNLLALSSIAVWPAARAHAAPPETAGSIPSQLAALERRNGGHLGATILDTGTGKLVQHRGAERFALCSTHKLLSAALVLARVDEGRESLSRNVVYGREALVSYSPVTEAHAGGDGMNVGALCEAALTVSDNTAANLLLDSVGGPPAVTAYLRTLGDPLTRLDRREPSLNEAVPGDPRDTTTPTAMAGLMRRIVLGQALSASSREQLSAWLVACRTGENRIRSGVPGFWRAGDKTGSGGRNTTNDIAVLWPPGRAPIIVTAYYTGSQKSIADREHVLAEVGRLAALG